MIPLRALIRMHSFPAVTLMLIVVNALCFLFELTLSPYGQQVIIERYALIPGATSICSHLSHPCSCMEDGCTSSEICGSCGYSGRAWKT